MRKHWLTGVAVVSLVGCFVGREEQSGNGGPGDAPALSAVKATIAGAHAVDATSYRVFGEADTADYRVQLNQRMRRIGKGSPKSKVDWNVPTNTPVRAAPATYGQWTTSSATDLLAFSVDNYNGQASPGISSATAAANIANWGTLSGASQTQASASTVFVMAGLYGTTPMLLGWNNNSSAPFGFSGAFFSFDPTNIQLFSLDYAGNLFCYAVPLPSGATYGAGQAGQLVTCNGGQWATSGFAGDSGFNVSWSSAYPVYNTAADISRVYYGDDHGRLNCVTTGVVAGSPASGSAPTNCAGYPATMVNNIVLGPPTVYQSTLTTNIVFIGDANGTVTRAVDTGVAPTLTKFCLPTNTAGACAAGQSGEWAVHGAPILDLGTNQNVYVAAGGKLFKAPLNAAWTSANVSSVSVFTPVTGSPIDASPSLDTAGGYAYITANNTLYKVAYPALTLIGGTPLYRPVQQNQVLTLASAGGTRNQTITPSSFPLGYPLPYYSSVFVGSGYGTQADGWGGSIGAPIRAALPVATVHGGFEQYGCTSGAAAPFLEGVTSATTFGALVESGAVLDFQNGNLNFGYDTGTTTPTGGIVQYPASAADPDPGWTCPSPSTTTTSSGTCGSVAGCGAPPSGSCHSNSDCTGGLRCDIFNDASYGTCVGCLQDSDCPGAATGTQVCNTNNAVYACVSTVHCNSNAQCTNTTDNPIYNASLKFCNTTAGTNTTNLCVGCKTNAQCSGATPVCDTNSSSPYFDTCVACVSDAKCTVAPNLHCDVNSGSPNLDTCVKCASNSQCSGGTPFCDTTVASQSTAFFDTCVACDANSQCGTAPNNVCVRVSGDTNYDKCKQCDSADQTACSGGTSCDLTSSDSLYETCTTCSPANGTSNASCPAISNLCNTAGNCVQCIATAACPGHAVHSFLVCDITTGFCSCDPSDPGSGDSDCPSGAHCNAATDECDL